VIKRRPEWKKKGNFVFASHATSSRGKERLPGDVKKGGNRGWVKKKRGKRDYKKTLKKGEKGIRPSKRDGPSMTARKRSNAQGKGKETGGVGGQERHPKKKYAGKRNPARVLRTPKAFIPTKEGPP